MRVAGELRPRSERATALGRDAACRKTIGPVGRRRRDPRPVSVFFGIPSPRGLAFDKITGPCHLCGRVGPLSFEHIPPRKAYNDYPAVLHEYEQLESEYGTRYLPDGRGGHTLCERCNNDTGGAYGTGFVEWSKLGFDRLAAVQGRRSANYHGEIAPLHVIKQVATIFFSVNGPGFQKQHPELARFVLDKERTGLPPRYRFHVFWYGGGGLRQSGVSAAMDLRRDRLSVLTEFVHPPFGYVLRFEHGLLDQRPEDISDFANYGYGERIQFNRRLPVLPTLWHLPGDYRSRDEIARDEAINTLEEWGVAEPEAVLDWFQRHG